MDWMEPRGVIDGASGDQLFIVVSFANCSVLFGSEMAHANKKWWPWEGEKSQTTHFHTSNVDASLGGRTSSPLSRKSASIYTLVRERLPCVLYVWHLLVIAAARPHVLVHARLYTQ